MKQEDIAKIAHEINRVCCAAYGDTSQMGWEEAPEWQRESSREGVLFHLSNPDAGPDATHINWMNSKKEDGWVYGPTKDADRKTHPCLVDFSDLPVEQQLKDYLFREVVHSLAPFLEEDAADS